MIQYVTFGDWLLFLSMILSRLIHTACVSVFHSFFIWWLRWQIICLQCGRPGFDPWVGMVSWRRRAWQPTAVFLPGESHGQRETGGLQSMGLQRVRHSEATYRACMQGHSTFTFLKNLQTYFQSNCTILLLHQQCTRGPIFPYSWNICYCFSIIIMNTTFLDLS